MEKNYYMIITNKRDYNCDIKNNFKFIGFPDRNRNSVKKFNIGDRIVFYVTKVSCFAAVVEVSGEYYYDNSLIWTDYEIWPHRIPCKVIKFINNDEDMIYIKDIWDDLSFIKNKVKWGSQVQGSFRKLVKSDYEIIEKNILDRSNKK